MSSGRLPAALCLPCRGPRADPRRRAPIIVLPFDNPTQEAASRVDARRRRDPAERNARRAAGEIVDRSRGAPAGVRSPAAAGQRDAEPRLDDQGRPGGQRVARRQRHGRDAGRSAGRARARRAARHRPAACRTSKRADRSPICSACLATLAQQIRASVARRHAADAIACRRRRRSSSCTSRAWSRKRRRRRWRFSSRR